MSDYGSALKGLLWFVAGCLATAAVFYFILFPQVKAAAAMSAHQAAMSAEQTAEQKLGTESSQLRQLQDELQSARSNLQTVTQQRDTCNAKFDRYTFLYSTTPILGSPVRTWIIPADVEPAVVNNTHGTYTHYDRKSQTETVHFEPKVQ